MFNMLRFNVYVSAFLNDLPRELVNNEPVCMGYVTYFYKIFTFF